MMQINFIETLIGAIVILVLGLYYALSVIALHRDEIQKAEVKE